VGVALMTVRIVFVGLRAVRGSSFTVCMAALTGQTSVRGKQHDLYFNDKTTEGLDGIASTIDMWKDTFNVEEVDK